MRSAAIKAANSEEANMPTNKERVSVFNVRILAESKKLDSWTNNIGLFREALRTFPDAMVSIVVGRHTIHGEVSNVVIHVEGLTSKNMLGLMRCTLREVFPELRDWIANRSDIVVTEFTASGPLLAQTLRRSLKIVHLVYTHPEQESVEYGPFDP